MMSGTGPIIHRDSYEPETGDEVIAQGIPQKDQAEIFQPFFRARNVTNVPGTGLGLTIVQRCAAFHGGTVELESREGVGAKFTAKFPLIVARHQPVPPGLESGQSLNSIRKLAPA